MNSLLCRLALLFVLLSGSLAHAEDFVGIVHPERDLTLSLGVGGVVARVDVVVGQKVRAGQALVELDDRMQAIEAERRRVVWQDQSEIKMQQARLVIVKSLYENARALFEKTGGISHEELQKMELEVISTEGRIDQLKAQEQREKLEFQGADQERQLLHLQAPIDGVVTHIDVDTGEWSKPGESMLRLVNSATCYLTVNVPRQAARDLETGSRLSLRAEGVAKPISGRLSFVSPVADAASGLVELRVTFDNPHGQVRPGSTGRVQLSAR